MKFSVIVAAHNEGPQIASALKRLRQISKTSPMEVVLVDGASDDGTADLAADWADTVLRHRENNRGAQWHAGAEKATGDLLFFLRADAQPPGNWQQALEHFWLTTAVDKVAAVGFTVDYGATAGLRLSRRLQTRGRLVLLKERIHAAARRVRAQGPLGYALKRVWGETRYRMGAKPEELFPPHASR
ncbi:MAG: glycosyltransferase [Elusimicrobia bacterium]|nr:glycosyltransferase [Elusimicrobiota bacterium]